MARAKFLQVPFDLNIITMISIKGFEFGIQVVPYTLQPFFPYPATYSLTFLIILPLSFSNACLQTSWSVVSTSIADMKHIRSILEGKRGRQDTSHDPSL